MSLAWSVSDEVKHGATVSLNASFEYNTKILSATATGSGSADLGSFAVSVFDVVTIKTAKGSADPVISYAKVYRDGKAVILPVEDKTADDYLVTVYLAEKTGEGEAVRTAIEPNAEGEYVLSENGLTGDTEVEIVYTKDTQSTVRVVEDGGAIVSAPSVVDAGANASITATPAANSYIENIFLTADDGEKEKLTLKYEGSNGKATTSFKSAAEKTKYSVYVETKPIRTIR